VAVCGYTPMLPGLMLYRGMYAMINEQAIVGFSNAGGAIAISASLAAGVVFGEKVARNLRRPRSYRAYTALQRAGRFSYRQAARAAAKGSSAARRIPRTSNNHKHGQASASAPENHSQEPTQTQPSRRKSD
ncbi:threonine/serine exporter family protein, partial [Corynebacterium propinquum]